MKNYSEIMAAVRGEKTPVPESASLHAVPDVGETTEPMAVVPAAPAVLAGRQMGFLDQARHQAAYTRQQVRELRHREGGVVHRLWHGQPRSMAQRAEYVQNRRWVKPGHEGGVADKGGTAFHKTIGPPLKVIGLAFSGAGDSPLVFFYAYFGALSLTELGLWLAGDSMIAVWVAVIHIAIVVVGALILVALTRRSADDDTEDEDGDDELAEIVTDPEGPTS